MSEQRYSYWLKSGIYSGMQKFSMLIFGVGSVLLLTRALSIDEMGVWSLFLVFTGTIETIRQSLIKNSVIKYLNSHSKEEHVFINSAALCLNMAITLFIGLILVLFAGPMSHALKAPALAEVLYIFLPGLLLLIPFSHFEWVQNANADFKGIFWSYMSRQGLSFGLILVHFFSGHPVTLTALILYFNIGLLAGTFVSGFFAWRFLERTFVPDKQWLKKLWHFGKFTFGTNVSATIFRNTDQVLVSMMFSTTGVALYSVCIRISNLVDLPSQVLGDILFPKSAQVMDEGNRERVRYYYEKAVGVVLAICIPGSILIMLFPKFVIGIIAGEQYKDAAYLLQLTMVYGLFLPFIKQFGTIMDSTGTPQLNFAVLTIVAVINIGICTLFVHQFGLPGAPLGTMLSYLICFIITQTILYRRFGAGIGNIFRHMIGFYPDMLEVMQQRLPARWKTR